MEKHSPNYLAVFLNKFILNFCNFFVKIVYLIKRQSCRHIKTSNLISSANQLTGFYIKATVVFNELNHFFKKVRQKIMDIILRF